MLVELAGSIPAAVTSPDNRGSNMTTTDYYRRFLKRRAALLEAAAEHRTERLPAGQVEAEAARNVAAAAPCCEFCPPHLGTAGCAVCRVLDGVTEAELTAQQ